MAKILVISDTHITPDNVEDSCILWEDLAKYCVTTKPDYIIHLGDVADLNSQARLISARGNHTLADEMTAVEHTLQSFHDVIDNYNSIRRALKKKMYRPTMILTQGNHDVRNGLTLIDDLFTSMGWDVYDYLVPVQVEGITFAHCLHKGLSDTACTTAQELIENWHSNIVVGHGHHRDYFESYSMAINDTIAAIRVPAFMLEPAEWAVQTQRKWSLGFTEIDTEPFSFVWRNFECLLENY
jgi:predicted phosphodiesterase